MAKQKIYFNTAEFVTTGPFTYESEYVKERSLEKILTALQIIGLMLFVAIVGVVISFHQSLRLDEAQTLWQTSHSVPRLLSIVAQDVHVPLYHIILHFWQQFFGNAVPVSRLISLGFFIATIPAVYFLGKESYGRKVGLFGALLVSISPFLNWYGSETRMYSMLVFMTVINQYFFIRLFRKTETAASWWGYFITAWIGMWVHYFFWFVLVTQFVYYLFNRRYFPENSGRKVFAIGTALVVSFVPWVYFVLKQGFAATTQPHLTEPTTYNLFDTFSQFIFGFQTDHLDTVLISLWPISMLMALLALRKDRRSGERRRIPPYTLYFLLSALLPVLMVFAISFVKPIYLSRYLIMTIPSLYLFLSWMITNYPPDIAKMVRILLVAAMLFTFANQTISAATPVKEDYQQAVQYLSQKATAQDAIVVAAPFTLYPVEYYYRGPAALETLPVWDQYAHGGLPVFSEQKLPDEVSQVDANHQVVWLLLSYDQGYNENIRLYYETHFQRIDEQTFSPGLTLYAYKVKY